MTVYDDCEFVDGGLAGNFTCKPLKMNCNEVFKNHMTGARTCPFAALLRALPSASEERLKAALAMLVVPWDYFEGANLHHVFEYPIEQLEMFLDDEAADREEVKSDE